MRFMWSSGIWCLDRVFKGGGSVCAESVRGTGNKGIYTGGFFMDFRLGLCVY